MLDVYLVDRSPSIMAVRVIGFGIWPVDHSFAACPIETLVTADDKFEGPSEREELVGDGGRGPDAIGPELLDCMWGGSMRELE